MTLSEVLRGGRQCDEDGTEIIMSRQACVEAADRLESLEASLKRFVTEFPCTCGDVLRCVSCGGKFTLNH